MYLAMVWNRVDIAEEKIFNNRELVWQEGELDMVMTKALLMQREKFVELLILNGFSMHKFLTVKVGKYMFQDISSHLQKLRDLYNEAAVSHHQLLEQVMLKITNSLSFLPQIAKFVGPCSYIYLRTIHK